MCFAGETTIWQGMDPCVCIRELGKAGALFHFHAKDTKVDATNTLPPGQPENVFTTGTPNFSASKMALVKSSSNFFAISCLESSRRANAERIIGGE